MVMLTYNQNKIIGISVSIICGLLWSSAYAQTSNSDLTVVRDSLKKLVPNALDVQGFTSIRPDDNVNIEDDIALDTSASSFMPGHQSDQTRKDRISRIRRCLYSSDGLYYLMISVTYCDSLASAQRELANLRTGTSRTLVRGSLTSGSDLGDESWVPKQPKNDFIYFRYGRIVASIEGGKSNSAGDKGYQVAFPLDALEAIANEILLKEVHDSKFADVPQSSVHLMVNGVDLGKNAVAVNDRTYVPAVAFANAMGYHAIWNAEKGILTLHGDRTKMVMLAIGDSKAEVGHTEVTLTSPVLKDNETPVMALADLKKLL